MTAQTLPNSGLVAGYVDGEDGWGAGMNENLRLLDALVNLLVEDKDLSAPPASPLAGRVYIVGASPTGAWAGQTSKLAVWCAGDDLSAPAWLFVAPKSGWRAWVIDESADYRFAAGAWALVPSGGGGGSTGMEWLPGKSSDYTPVLADANKAIPFSSTLPFKLVIPPGWSVGFPDGTTFVIYQESTGSVTVEGMEGVVIHKRGGGALSLAGQYAMASLTKRSSNEWILTGDLAA